VDWSQIQPMPAAQQLCHEELAPVKNEQEMTAILRQLVVVKLNSGLGKYNSFFLKNSMEKMTLLSSPTSTTLVNQLLPMQM
jgi:hypothetical protein